MSDKRSCRNHADGAEFIAPARHHLALGSPELRQAQKRHMSGFVIGCLAIGGFVVVAGAVMAWGALQSGELSSEARNLLVVGGGSLVSLVALFLTLMRD